MGEWGARNAGYAHAACNLIFLAIALAAPDEVVGDPDMGRCVTGEAARKAASIQTARYSE